MCKTMSRRCSVFGIGPMVGNNVSHANNRTKRRFMPNLQNVSYKSGLLGIVVRMRVITSTHRTILKNGGIDEFLLNIDSRKLTEYAVKLKKSIQKKVPQEVIAITA
jgi:large subunit ribosomal protein L28